MISDSGEKLIGIVGPCSAGKSTLITKLIELGYKTRHIAQEHSYVPDMWQRITHPDILVYLDVSFEISQARRYLDWTQLEFEKQKERLIHAYQNADLVINTDQLSHNEVLILVLEFLNNRSQGNLQD